MRNFRCHSNDLNEFSPSASAAATTTLGFANVERTGEKNLQNKNPAGSAIECVSVEAKPPLACMFERHFPKSPDTRRTRVGGKNPAIPPPPPFYDTGVGLRHRSIALLLRSPTPHTLYYIHLEGEEGKKQGLGRDTFFRPEGEKRKLHCLSCNALHFCLLYQKPFPYIHINAFFGNEETGEIGAFPALL